MDAATEKRRAAAQRAHDASAFVLRTAEQSGSVFDPGAEQVSGYAAQFVAQERADRQLAESKLEHKWFGPQLDDLGDDAALNLSGKVREARSSTFELP